MACHITQGVVTGILYAYLHVSWVLLCNMLFRVQRSGGGGGGGGGRAQD